jgi:uncharacterized membrane protein YhaH (DUF805 family)
MTLLQLLFGFQGRIRRSQYWLSVLGGTVGLSVLATAAIALMGSGADSLSGVGMVLLGLIVTLSTWMGLALGVKRCHDRDRSGAFMALGLVPLVSFWLLIELGFLDGTPGPNRYGPSPKGLGAAAAVAA